MLTGFRSVPKTGVIYVMAEAHKKGYRSFAPQWSNLGQGQPEIGVIPHAPDRIHNIEVPQGAFEYAPVLGVKALRQAVADYYNRTYRRGMKSQYTYENVSISSGGRAALTRAAAALGEINLGHFLPDYTAYEELLSVYRLFSPIPILLDPAQGYAFSNAALELEITGRGLFALLLSNPCNPTGKLICGDELAQWTETARRLDCAMLFDEFYSHYIWRDGTTGPSSAAAYVEDVDQDPVVIFDGLTKNWRYPGWRVAWTVGPKSVITAVGSAGSFLDGGGSHPLQEAAIPLLDDAHVQRESQAIRSCFSEKRSFMLNALKSMGMKIDRDPDGTFYVWANLENMPEGLQDGMSFFQQALEHQVICVPGEFFDVNPGQRRANRISRFKGHVRFSFGPNLDSLKGGIERLKSMIATAK
jgi:aspartate/methionine/tyrosine aminotransferase